MEVGGQFHSLATLPPGKNRRLSVGKEKNLVSSELWNLVCPAPTV